MCTLRNLRCRLFEINVLSVLRCVEYLYFCPCVLGFKASHFIELCVQAKLKEKVEAAGGRIRSGTTGVGRSELHVAALMT